MRTTRTGGDDRVTNLDDDDELRTRQLRVTFNRCSRSEKLLEGSALERDGKDNDATAPFSQSGAAATDSRQASAGVRRRQRDRRGRMACFARLYDEKK